MAATRALRRGLLYFAAFLLVLILALFLPAGKITWWRGWIFVIVYLATSAAATAYLWRTNPEVVVARSTIHRQGQPAAQALLLAGLLVAFIAIFTVAALDAMRYHWSSVSPWLTIVGYALYLTGTAGQVWALRVNKFAEPSVRIQTERQQRVVDTGPYATVRHPLYATGLLVCAGIPLALGSLWALVPAGIGTALIVARTALEDRMLQADLAGYRDYAARVRYRLVPGIW